MLIEIENNYLYLYINKYVVSFILGPEGPFGPKGEKGTIGDIGDFGLKGYRVHAYNIIDLK